MALRVACPPYDVINTEEARKLAENNPFSFLHVTRPEIDLAPGIDEHGDEVYAQGQKSLEAMVGEGVLFAESEPRLYLYAQRMGQHRQLGVVACASVADYDQDRIKKHEKTRADKEDDRTRHIDSLSAHDEPVFLTYRADAEIDRLVREVERAEPVYDFVTSDDVAHQLWVIDRDTSLALSRRFEAVPSLYVADGHHRSAAASRVAKLRRGQGGEHDLFLAVIFPHDQMQIMAYNRVVRDLERRSPSSLLALLRERFDLAEGERKAPSEAKTFGIYLDKRWWQARVRPGTYDAADPVASLDCSICQDQILGPLFGVTDPRRDSHVDFVGGIRGAAELERRVDSGEMSVAIHLFPTQLEELMAVSDAGKLMPPKSTWFEPKLRSGLFVHAF